MTKRQQQGLILLALSVPMMWWGFTNFMGSGTNSTALAMGIAISCTLGSLFAISGLVMLATKNSLGIWNPDDKGKKDRGVVLASQANVGASSVQKEIINKKQKVNEMAKAKEFELADAVEEFRSLGEVVKKANLDVKTATEKRAILRDKIAKNKFSIDEDGKLDTIK